MSNAEVNERLIIKDTISTLKRFLQNRLQEKTGWGRNELLAEFDKAALEAEMDILLDKSRWKDD